VAGFIPAFFIAVQIDRIHQFDIRFFRVSYSIKLAAFQAGGWADT
jgi:hypothetical protein